MIKLLIVFGIIVTGIRFIITGDLTKLSDAEFLNLIFNEDLYDEALGKVLKEYKFSKDRIRYNHIYKLISIYFDWLILELEKNKAEDIDEDLIDYRLSVLYQYDK